MSQPATVISQSSMSGATAAAEASLFRRERPRQDLRRVRRCRLLLSPLLSAIVILAAAAAVVLSWTQLWPKTLAFEPKWLHNKTTAVFQFQSAEPRKHSHDTYYSPAPAAGTRSNQTTAAASPSQKSQNKKNTGTNGGPYHNWELFSADYQEMMRTLKIFVYPDAWKENHRSSPFNSIFFPLTNPADPKLGNYFSEHAFKVALLGSSLVTRRPEEAHFFYMPFSINAMRNHPLLHSASSISDFVSQYTTRISSEFAYWNASGGADHFYVCCHSIGREAASKHSDLHNNAIQVTCSSSYFQRLYITHKDIGLPQVWPRREEPITNPPEARNILLFFAGRAQNSLIRQKILDLWSNETSFAMFSGSPSFSYEVGYRTSRYCLHVKGYEVNTARVSDAVHYGCIPVLISDYYDLPFANILDWSKFSIIIGHEDIILLKKILFSVPRKKYVQLYKNLSLVRRHFVWHTTPTSYDSFYMTAYELWLKRGTTRMIPATCQA